MCKTLTIIILTANILLHAAPAVELKLRRTPRFMFAPGYAVLSLSIEPDARNRQYCITYDGGISGSRCRQLAGASAPRTQEELMLRDLPAGHYVAVAEVGRNDTKTVTSSRVEWDVLEPGSDPVGF